MLASEDAAMKSNRPLRFTLTATAAFVAVSAWFGGIALVAWPSGAALGATLAVLEGTPFTSFLVPALALLVLVAGSQTAAALAHLRRRPDAASLSLAAAVTLAGFLVVELVLIGPHVLQLIFGLLALGQAYLASRALFTVPSQAPTTVEERALAFLSHERVAFVGLSTNPNDFSRVVARLMKERGIEVVPVHPNAPEIDGGAAWTSVGAMPIPPEAVLVMVPAERVPGVVDDCVAAGVRTIWFHRGAGPGATHEAAIARAEDAGITVVRDACPMMFLEPDHWMHRTHAALRRGAWQRTPHRANDVAVDFPAADPTLRSLRGPESYRPPL
jgi:predicted CoA-binding protein